MLKRVLPHVSIVCSLMLLVLYIINLFNDAMGFLRGPEFEFLLLIAIFSAFFTGSIDKSQKSAILIMNHIISEGG